MENTLKMKNTFLKTIGTTLAILMLAAFTSISAFAQEGKANEEENSLLTLEKSSDQNRSGAKALEGSWNIQVTRRNCQTGEALATFPTMSTFMHGGTMQDYGVAMAPAGRGPGHGVWSFESGRRFTSAFQFFLFASDGSHAGRQIIRREIELDRSGSEYTATGSVTVFNTGGTLIATICTVETGTRFE
jgi:hypothetical protein